MPGEDLEQRRLPRPVAADDAHYLAALDLERDVLQGPDGVVRRLTADRRPLTADGTRHSAEGGIHSIGQSVAQGFVALARADAVEFAQVFDADGNI